MHILRKYVHKTHGLIGTVGLTVPNDGWAITLPPDADNPEPEVRVLTIAGVQHLANFALQTLQDSYANAAANKSKSDAIAAWESKLAKILEGTIGTRASGPRDPERTEAIKIATRDVRGITDPKAKRAAAEKLVDSNPRYLARARDNLAWSAETAESDGASPPETESAEPDADESHDGPEIELTANES